jgi:hypothetical protein
MRSWNELPQELLVHVFESATTTQILSRRDLCTCQLVCKNWTTPAQRVCYSAIELDEDGAIELFYKEKEFYCGHFVNHSPSISIQNAQKKKQGGKAIFNFLQTYSLIWNISDRQKQQVPNFS